MTHLEKELTVAIDAARQAGDIILKYYNADYHVRGKSNNSPVTTADLEADHYLRSTILKVFPGDGWLSEETKDTTARLTKNRVWVVDPLDGTIEFILGIPEFVVSIALTIKGKPVAGVVYNPVTRELFSARSGDRSRLNGVPISCSRNTELKDATVYVSRSETKKGLWDSYKDVFKMLIISGSIAYKLVHTAANHSDLTISLQPKNEWDICAGDMILRNAGGTLMNRQLEPIHYNSEDPFIPNGLIAGPPILADKAKNIFKVKGSDPNTINLSKPIKPRGS